jgi:hypothetical protein
VNTTLLEPVSHAERELAAYNNAMSAAKRKDYAEHARLWAEFKRIHAQRPAEVVRAMEVKMGLR